MRPIKFRAWDGLGMRYTHDGWNSDVDVFCELWQTISSEYGYIVMQFTGLTDRNGVEIYEGDIVVVDYGEDCLNQSTKEMRVIEWVDTGLTWRRPKDGYLPGHLHSGKSQFMEVIGNIYEHKHLLEAE